MHAIMRGSSWTGSAHRLWPPGPGIGAEPVDAARKAILPAPPAEALAAVQAGAPAIAPPLAPLRGPLSTLLLLGAAPLLLGAGGCLLPLAGVI